MFGNYYRRVGVGWANGPTASACSAEPWVAVCDGCGIRRIMCGRRFTRNTRGGGCTSTPVRAHGTSPVSTQKVCRAFLLVCITRLTESGWGRKLSYCIAFSIDGATDVTRRYVRSPIKHGAPRNRASEEVVHWVILEIRRKRRENLSKSDQKRLMKEDEREEKELRKYTASALAAELNNLFNGTSSAGRPDEVKTPASREEAAAEWLSARQRSSGQSGPDRSQDGR